MDSTDAIDSFALAANEYCQWAEGEPLDAVTDARTARRLTAELFRRAIDLPKQFVETSAPDLPADDFRRIYLRFGTLPFNYYSKCFDPLTVPGEDPVVADLADDLADIWRDIKAGLQLWRAGSVGGAAWHWRFHFDTHWGHHASSSLFALQSWFAQYPDDADEDV